MNSVVQALRLLGGYSLICLFIIMFFASYFNKSCQMRLGEHISADQIQCITNAVFAGLLIFVLAICFLGLSIWCIKSEQESTI
jgi:hypothetical protein